MMLTCASSHYGSLKLTWLQLVSACLFSLGYALREYGAYNYLYREDSSSPLILFVLSQVFIYVCPSVALTISGMTLC